MYKFKSWSHPKAIQSMFTLNSTMHSYSTRSSSKFHIFGVRTNFFKSTVRHQGPIVWNSLNCLSPARNVFQFKKHLKKYLLTNNAVDN